jgi:Zn-dependent protease
MAYFILILAIIFGLTIHEYFHGWTAYMLGDDTAKVMGRLTVNPLAHFDPILTSMIFIVGLGAAKPVPINVYKVKYGRNGLFLVSAAGIIANMVSALVFMLVLKMAIFSGNFSSNSLFFDFLKNLIQLNLVLAVFNLIPLPPLDGSKILLSLFPGYQNIYRYFSENQIASLFLAIFLFSTFGYIVINFIYGILIGIIF